MKSDMSFKSDITSDVHMKLLLNLEFFVVNLTHYVDNCRYISHDCSNTTIIQFYIFINIVLSIYLVRSMKIYSQNVVKCLCLQSSMAQC